MEESAEGTLCNCPGGRAEIDRMSHIFVSYVEEDGAPVVEIVKALEEYDTAVISLRKLVELEPGYADGKWVVSETFGD